MRDTISPASIASRRPHRLVAQDGALSRLKQGFESPWGHRSPSGMMGFFIVQTGAPMEGMLFESPWGHRSPSGMMGFFIVQTGAPMEGMLFEFPCPHQGAAQGHRSPSAMMGSFYSKLFAFFPLTIQEQLPMMGRVRLVCREVKYPARHTFGSSNRIGAVQFASWFTL